MSTRHEIPVAGGRSQDEADVHAELERVLAEAEATMAEVRRELLERRRQDAQHAEIDRLEEHFANAVVRWDEVRGFFDEVLTELRRDVPHT